MSQHREIEAWSFLTTRILAPNPGPMTLDGTNTYVVRHPGSHRMVVVDPGPEDHLHLDRIQSLGQVELILLTHRHVDHSEGAALLARRSGASVRAFDDRFCDGATTLTDGEVIRAGGTSITVLATPGHTDDSACFFLAEDRSLEHRSWRGSMLTGDTILGQGTTVVAFPDGSLDEYMRTLERLIGLADHAVLPGHGGPRESVVADARHYRAHRLQRLSEIDHVVRELEGPSGLGVVTVESVADLVYPALIGEARAAATAMVAANLTYLRERAGRNRMQTRR